MKKSSYLTLDGETGQVVNSKVKVLHLNLKKKWFDMIRSGVKTEEYRELKKYWYMRLWDDDTDYDFVCFRNGYSPIADEIIFEFGGVSMAMPNIDWTDKPDQVCFVITLGEKVYDFYKEDYK
jgi:hypothetical protein